MCYFASQGLVFFLIATGAHSTIRTPFFALRNGVLANVLDYCNDVDMYSSEIVPTRRKGSLIFCSYNRVGIRITRSLTRGKF